MTEHIVSISGGMASAIAADRVIERFGKDRVTLWFADTNWEDEDLFRFQRECLERWGMPLTRYSDGRTPLQVAEDEHIIPNQKIAPCSRVLKFNAFSQWLADQPKPAIVYLGMDWREGQRKKTQRDKYESVDGVSVDFPLDWKPIEYRPYEDVIRSWGIEPPRLYLLGFGHNNCGGRCVRQGVSEWKRLWVHFPARFAEVEQWEQEQRVKGEPWSRYAIAKRERERADGTKETIPVTLEQLRKEWEMSLQPGLDEVIIDDREHCFCSF